MRKVEQQMVVAVRRLLDSDATARGWKSGNTVVELEASDRVVVYLHGNLIARITASQIDVTLAGWNTPTTRSRINALLNEFAPGHWVFSLAGLPHLHRPEFGDHRRGNGIGSSAWIVLPREVVA